MRNVCICFLALALSILCNQPDYIPQINEINVTEEDRNLSSDESQEEYLHEDKSRKEEPKLTRDKIVFDPVSRVCYFTQLEDYPYIASNRTLIFRLRYPLNRKHQVFSSFFHISLLETGLLLRLFDKLNPGEEGKLLSLKVREYLSSNVFVTRKDLLEEKKTALRIHFPNGYVLQSIFEAEETIQDVKSVIKSVLERTRKKFYLYKKKPFKKFNDPTMTLRQCELVPTADLYFATSRYCFSRNYIKPRYITHKLVSHAVACKVALMWRMFPTDNLNQASREYMEEKMNDDSDELKQSQYEENEDYNEVLSPDITENNVFDKNILSEEEYTLKYPTDIPGASHVKEEEHKQGLKADISEEEDHKQQFPMDIPGSLSKEEEDHKQILPEDIPGPLHVEEGDHKQKLPMDVPGTSHVEEEDHKQKYPADIPGPSRIKEKMYSDSFTSEKIDEEESDDEVDDSEVINEADEEMSSGSHSSETSCISSSLLDPSDESSFDDSPSL